MSRWVRRVIVGLALFNVTQVVGWAILSLPSLTLWRHSIAWLNFESWYANQVGAIAAAGTSLIMIEQMRRDGKDKDKK